MRALLATLAAASLISVGAAAAEPDHSAHHAAKPAEVTHEMCKAMMGAQMQGRPAHDHGRDKTGAATPGMTKPPTAAEMEAMHKACAEKMAKPAAEQPASKAE